MSSKRIHELPDAGAIDLEQRFPVELVSGTEGTKRQTIGRVLAKAQQTAGLKPWTARIYTEGECAIVDGVVKQFQSIGSDGSEFYAEEWILVGKKPTEYGYPDYDPEETYSTNDRITFGMRLFRQTSLTTCSGITPVELPSGPTFWTEVSISEDRFGRDYDAALADDGYEVVGLKGDVVKKVYQGETRLYEAKFSDMGGPSFGSTDFENELRNGDWIELAAGVVRGFEIELPGLLENAPGETETTRTFSILSAVPGFAFHCLYACLTKISESGSGSDSNPVSILVKNGLNPDAYQLAALFDDSNQAFNKQFIPFYPPPPGAWNGLIYTELAENSDLVIVASRAGVDYIVADYRLNGTYVMIRCGV